MGRKRVDLTGRRFGRLVVAAFAGSDLERRAAMWFCRCDCGAERTFMAGNLTKGHATSCGCLKAEVLAARSITHGHSRVGKHTAEYRTWAAMRARCGPHASGHSRKNYFERGIRVCERWQVFENFLADMGPKPPGLTIDRINNDGDYEPGNCRWATVAEQNRNTRKSPKYQHEEHAR